LAEDNPYTPPNAPVEAIDTGPAVLPLASRGARLLARVVDGLTQVAALAPGIGLAIAALQNGQRLPDESLLRAAVLVSGVLAVALLGVNCYLLDQAGQTLGKKALGIRIVDEEGERVPLLRLLALRVGPMFLLELIPYLGPALGLLNVLPIFGRGQRCLHDRMAGTVVIRT
jgi:uncharacterized RDD family membrane protein YckC